jgi:diguanylate cyclase (GGDEF)-like protein
LTQIHNRRSIEELCKKFNANIKRFHTTYSVIMFDIDHFKEVNDKWGHTVGDDVLQELVRRIDEEIRDTDHLGRWGGEEFVIFCKMISLGATINYADRLRECISQKEFDTVGKLTISLGVATSKEGEAIEEVILRADKALYMAKEEGRDQVRHLT